MITIRNGGIEGWDLCAGVDEIVLLVGVPPAQLILVGDAVIKRSNSGQKIVPQSLRITYGANRNVRIGILADG